MKKAIVRGWADISIELLESIALSLSIVDVQRFRLVCSSWYNAAKIYPSGPCLILTPSQVTEERSLQLLSIQNKKVVYTSENNLDKLLDNGFCYGCAHGWLFVLDKFADPWLLNLFSGRIIQLPKRRTPPNLPFYMSPDDFRHSAIEKAILTANPTYDRNYKVITVLDDLYEVLSFCNNRDYEWTFLGSGFGHYSDVVWHENMLYALLEYQGIEVWDLKDCVLQKSLSFWPPHLKAFDYQHDPQFYLVPYGEGVLVVVRYIYFPAMHNQPTNIRSHLTVKFMIWMLDLIQGTLSEVKSLEDEAVFVGRNETHLVSTKNFEGLKKDSIYFTDGFLAGYDVGIFSLQEDRIEILSDPNGAHQLSQLWVLLY